MNTEQSLSKNHYNNYEHDEIDFDLDEDLNDEDEDQHIINENSNNELNEDDNIIESDDSIDNDKYYGESFDPFNSHLDFAKTDFLTLYKCLALFIANKIRRNNRDFVKLLNIYKQNPNNNVQNVKKKKRSSSTNRNNLNVNTNQLSKSKDNLLNNEEDWELSCTLDQKSKQIQKSNKSINNFIDNKYNAFIDDELIHSIDLHILVNKHDVTVEEI